MNALEMPLSMRHMFEHYLANPTEQRTVYWNYKSI